jgi:hypothetical protein
MKITKSDPDRQSQRVRKAGPNRCTRNGQNLQIAHLNSGPTIKLPASVGPHQSYKSHSTRNSSHRCCNPTHCYQTCRLMKKHSRQRSIPKIRESQSITSKPASNETFAQHGAGRIESLSLCISISSPSYTFSFLSIGFLSPYAITCHTCRFPVHVYSPVGGGGGCLSRALTWQKTRGHYPTTNLYKKPTGAQRARLKSMEWMGTRQWHEGQNLISYLTPVLWDIRPGSHCEPDAL